MEQIHKRINDKNYSNKLERNNKMPKMNINIEIPPEANFPLGDQAHQNVAKLDQYLKDHGGILVHQTKSKRDGKIQAQKLKKEKRMK